MIRHGEGKAPALQAQAGMVFQHFELFPHLSKMGFARQVAHRVVFMDHGCIVEDATQDDFFGKPRSERAQQFLAKILSH